MTLDLSEFQSFSLKENKLTLANSMASVNCCEPQYWRDARAVRFTHKLNTFLRCALINYDFIAATISDLSIVSIQLIWLYDLNHSHFWLMMTD